MKRIVDKKLLAEVAKRPCAISGCRWKSDPHHIRHVGARGNDDERNLVPLCRLHHSVLHGIGVLTFYRRYMGLIETSSSIKLGNYLESRGMI